MAIYCKKLKNSMKNKFIQYKTDSRNLGDLICISIELNNKIFFQFVEKQGIKLKYNRTGFAY